GNTMIRPAIFAIACASVLGAQQPAAQGGSTLSGGTPLSRSEIAELAKTQFAITAVQDSNNVQLAKPSNKKPEVQEQLREKRLAQVAEVLHHNGMTDAEYRRRTYLVSVDTSARKIFDSVIVVLSGQALPGTAVGAQAKLPVPPGAPGIEIGYVVNTFKEAPLLQGLLPAAIAEAKIAIQHAGLAGRQPTNLEYMKTHAGHVINALDPTIIKQGPGQGYGVKRAALGVAEHIELAAKAEGATPAIQVHATHIAMTARNTITRADAIIAIAQKILASTSAPEAASLVAQMASAADQLIAGADANNDGRITWEQGEGGLQVAEDHVKLMLGVRP
ncbi:MAG TPA: hypothetical protein VF483_02820, partial [Gemmatimonadaceae bacterium]